MINEVLKEREKRYGDFETHAFIAQDIKFSMWTSRWNMLEADQKEALEMIAHKIARILNGDPTYADNWIDIAGYSQLVANRLIKEQK